LTNQILNSRILSQLTDLILKSSNIWTVDRPGFESADLKQQLQLKLATKQLINCLPDLIPRQLLVISSKSELAIENLRFAGRDTGDS